MADKLALSTAGEAPEGGLSAAVQRSFSPQAWIVGPWQDLVLFVATPLVILPLALGVQLRFTAEQIALVVASFGALGHHLPGMMRAYGDRALFQRFRKRFIVAPIFLVSVCALFTVYDLQGLVLIAYLWGVWHGLMQTYGFIRIYDSKTGSPSAWTRRLDHWMCLMWFVGGVTLSDARMYTVLDHFYRSGGPVIPAAGLDWIRWGTMGLLVAVTSAFVVNFLVEMRRGNAPNLIKILLMGTSFGFWWYCSIFIDNILVGIALFEVFHDVQYLSLVWLFNRKRVEKGGAVGSFTKFLFRRSGAMAGVYVGLVFAYGSMNLFAGAIETETVKDVLMGVLIASALLHFYYDAFIWKVHEKQNRETLGLASDADGERKGPPPWLVSGAKWSLFVLPLVILGVIQTQGEITNLRLQQSLVASMPDHATARYNLGVALDAGDQTDNDQAFDNYQRAVELDPNYASAHYNLGSMLKRRGEVEAAIVHLERALELDPTIAQAYNNLANIKQTRGEAMQAVALYRKAIELEPQLYEARHNLAALLRQQGDSAGARAVIEDYLEDNPGSARARLQQAQMLLAEGDSQAAIEHLLEAVASQPDYGEAQLELGITLGATGDIEGARAALDRAVELLPTSAEARLNRGIAAERSGDVEDARKHYLAALAVDPEHVAAYESMASLERAAGNTQRAVELYRQALDIEPRAPRANLELGVTLANAGQLPEAIELYMRALESRPDWPLVHLNLANALVQTDRLVEAGQHYRQALELEPSLDQARQNLAAVEQHLSGAAGS